MWQKSYRALIDRAVEAALKGLSNLEKTELVAMADRLDEAKKMESSTLEWLATANGHVKYSNQSGTYNQVERITREKSDLNH